MIEEPILATSSETLMQRGEKPTGGASYKPPFGHDKKKRNHSPEKQSPSLSLSFFLSCLKLAFLDLKLAAGYVV